MKLEKYRRFWCILICGVLLILLTGCTSIQEGLKKAVMMEYDQRLNFERVALVSSIPGVGSDIRARNGVWLLYHICSLTNDASDEAQDFEFDVTKFYVVGFDDKIYYADDLQFPDVMGQGPSANYPAIDDGFRKGVQTAPMTQTISANSSPMLALSWRFAILIDQQPAVNWSRLAYNLRYDNSGGESIILTGRGHEPVWGGEIHESNLTHQCRPELN